MKFHILKKVMKFKVPANIKKSCGPGALFLYTRDTAGNENLVYIGSAAAVEEKFDESVKGSSTGVL